MITTYLIENNKKEVLGYYRKLRDAKADLELFNNTSFRILCLKGNYFGEG